MKTEESFRGAGGRRPPRKKKKRKKKKKKEKRKKKKKKERRELWTASNYYIKCCFFQFFNSPVTLKNKKKFGPPRKSWNDAPGWKRMGQSPRPPECATRVLTPFSLAFFQFSIPPVLVLLVEFFLLGSRGAITPRTPSCMDPPLHIIIWLNTHTEHTQSRETMYVDMTDNPHAPTRCLLESRYYTIELCRVKTRVATLTLLQYDAVI